MALSEIVNLILSVLTTLGQILIVVLSILILIKKWKPELTPKFDKVFAFIGKHGIALAFTVALVSTLGSLTYSDILGYEPCKLCWFQRIFMYPQIFLLGIALYRREKTIIPYALLLAVFGEIIALYHYIIQLGFLPAPCTVSGYSVSCAKKFILQFGYITIPLMAFTAFVMIIFFLMLSKRSQ